MSGSHVTFTPSLTAAGTGTVTFTATDGYLTSNAGTITIGVGPAAAAPATIIVQNLTQTYSGAPGVTVTTVPSGLATAVTYNGSATAPTAAGTYPVVATVTDPNYTAAPATGTFTISKPRPPSRSAV